MPPPLESDSTESGDARHDEEKNGEPEEEIRPEAPAALPLDGAGKGRAKAGLKGRSGSADIGQSRVHEPE